MKKIIILLFLTSLRIFSQAPAFDWMQRYGGTGGEYFRSVTPTQDGGFIMGGWSNSGISGNKTENTIGFNFDYWVVKTNSQGAIEWQKTIGGGRFWAFGEENGDILNVVKQASDGGYFLGGYSDSPIIGLKTTPNYGFNDFWVVKLDDLGNLLWQTDLGGNSEDQLYTLEATPDGGCITGGPSFSNISGNKTENSKGLYDYWVVKLDANGQQQWQKTIGGSSSDILTSILVLDNGEYLLAGYSGSNISGDKTEDSKGGSTDFWIVKINSIGTILWQKTIGGNDADLLNKAIKTNDGFLFGGESYSSISFDKTESNRGITDFWAVKTDSNGVIVWDKTFGGLQEDRIYDIKSYNNNGYLLAGGSDSSLSGDKTEASFGDRDGWLIRINEEGVQLWQKTIGGSDFDGINQVIAMPDNSILVGGMSASPISGNNTTSGYGLYDYWLVKFFPETLGTVGFSETDLYVYPNPTTGLINISFGEQQEKVTATLTTLLGQVVSSETYSGIQNISYPISEASGIYFLTLENENQQKKTIKIVKN